MATLVRKLSRVLTRLLITGNLATATHLITIDDNVNPTLIAPASLTAVCAISEQPAYTTYAEFTAAGGTASDNCGIDDGSFTMLSEVSDGNTCPEVITRTYQMLITAATWPQLRILLPLMIMSTGRLLLRHL